jgi:hypothetical protein
MSDASIAFVSFAALIGLFFFTPRRTRFSPRTTPAGPGVRGMGLVLLLLLGGWAALHVLWHVVLRGGRP